MKSFSTEWRALIDCFVLGGSVAIKVNDDTANTCKRKNALDKVTRYR